MSVISDIQELRGSVHAILTQNKDEDAFLKILEDVRKCKGDVVKNTALVLEVVKQKASRGPMDDRTMMMERMIGVVASLPEDSFARKKMTGVLVDQLWNSLQHPPLSYLSDKYQYRQPDGSCNNIMYPDLGKANTPYARTVRTEVKAPGARPDPGLLFDLLMARGDDTKTNEAGISSMLLYHASIITHDIFQTSRTDTNISTTSSYLDLAPLYGSSQEHQNKIRTFRNGEIKPDTFHEKRLLAFPPGVNVMLIMYSRFHNYVARTLAAINEGGRFTPSPFLDLEAGELKRDNDLFNVARLVTNGLYINICLHDYLRAIANVPSTESSWTLDPRVEITKAFDKQGVPRGVGNQVSCEFNLLYRFHPAISCRDAKWTKDFYATIFPGEDPFNISIPRLLQGIGKFEKSIHQDPSQRTFAGLARQADGTFNDDELVNILKESIEDPAGAFGANRVPDILKSVEILGIVQARKWNLASLNEFREFFELKRYEKFEDINPDPYVASTLQKLYGHVDNVEMYPGMFLEANKPKLEPGMGLCAPYTVTRAVFSDAITLVRGDRYLTLDYTPANLTNWGITEVAPDHQTLGGAKMSHLILNAFPRHFKFNSVYAMQPFYTPDENRKIFTKFKTAGLYSFDPPSLQPPIIPIVSHAALNSILADQKNFKVPWGAKMESLERYMLAGDNEANIAQRKLVGELIYGADGAMQRFRDFTEGITTKLLKRESYELGRNGLHQVDIVHICNIAALHFASALCYLPLSTDPDSPTCSNSYSEEELYRVLCNLTAYVFSDADPTKSWTRRRESRKGTSRLCDVMEGIVRGIPPEAPPAAKNFPITRGLAGFARGRVEARVEQARGIAGIVTGIPAASGSKISHPLKDYGLNIAKKLLGSGKNPREVSEIMVGTASAFVANTATSCAQLIDFYLQDANKAHWAEIQRLSKQSTVQADQTLTKYVLEGARLSNSLGIFRDVEPVNGPTIQITQNGKNFTAKRGDKIFVSFIAASRDPTVFPNPQEVRLDRDIDSYITFGQGPHQCLGKEINILHNLTMLKAFANLRNLRRTPGDEGKLKFITKPGGIKLYMTPDWSEFSPYPTTMKLMFDGAP